MLGCASANQMAPLFKEKFVQEGSSSLPTVFMHGMGDSCFNPGMKSITAAVGTHLGKYFVAPGKARGGTGRILQGWERPAEKGST